MGNVLKKYNGTNWDIVGGAVTGDTLPIGAIIPYGGAVAPTGWLMCDGSMLNRETYKELFEAIGTSFGTDGPGNFYIPDLRGKVVVGQDGADADFGMGATGGEKTHTLTMANLPSRTTVAVSFDGGLLSYSEWKGGQVSSGFYNSTLADMNLENEQPFNVMPPYQVTNYIIKAFQSSGVVAQVSNTKSDSTTDTYSCDYINGIGKKLWEGNFTSGSITAPGISKYQVLIVNVGGCLCFGSKGFGLGGVGMYGSYSSQIYNYRFNIVGDTVTIDDLNKGGSDGTTNVAITAIYGLF